MTNICPYYIQSEGKKSVENKPFQQCLKVGQLSTLPQIDGSEFCFDLEILGGKNDHIQCYPNE